MYGSEYRGFFVFDLSGVTGNITAVRFKVFQPYNGFYSPSSGSETVNFWDISTPVSTLIANTGGNVVFADLGSGNTYADKPTLPPTTTPSRLSC